MPDARELELLARLRDAEPAAQEAFFQRVAAEREARIADLRARARSQKDRRIARRQERREAGALKMLHQATLDRGCRRPRRIDSRPRSARAPRPATNVRRGPRRGTDRAGPTSSDDPHEPEPELPLDPGAPARLSSPERGRRYRALGLDSLQIAAAEDAVRAVIRRQYGAAR